MNNHTSEIASLWFMNYLIYMLFNINSFIQYETITHVLCITAQPPHRSQNVHMISHMQDIYSRLTPCKPFQKDNAKARHRLVRTFRMNNCLKYASGKTITTLHMAKDCHEKNRIFYEISFKILEDPPWEKKLKNLN